jgi:hypothetical protein
MFKQNESNIDRIIRLLVGVLALFLAAFVFKGALQIVALVLGILGVFTGLTGFCLIYKILRIKTK